MMNEEWAIARDLIDKCFEDESTGNVDATLEEINVHVVKKIVRDGDNIRVLANINISAEVWLD